MNILEKLYAKKPLISSHRGKSGGNIIENTINSAKCAMLSGADIVEFDVTSIRKKKEVIFHTGMERRLFGLPLIINSLSVSMIKKLRCKNAIADNSGYVLNTLEEYLIALKGKCLLNLDRIEHSNIKRTIELVAKYDMFDQIIFKSKPNANGEKILQALSSYNNAYFMAICVNPPMLENAIKLCEKYNVKLSAVEVIFTKEDDYFCSEEFFSRAKENGWATWVNAIVLNARPDMCANHGDDTSILESPNQGWGWLLDKGYDIIQTDWPCLLSNYIKSRKE